MSTQIAVSGEALFGKIRRELLCLFFLNPDRSFYLLELVAILQTGRGGVQRELANLTESGIIRREKTGVKAFFSVADDSPIFVQMQNLLEKMTDIRKMISSAVKSAGNTVNTAILSPIIISESIRSVKLLIVCDEINELFHKEIERIRLLTGIEIQMEIVRRSELSVFIEEHSFEEWISPETGFLLAGRSEDLIPEKHKEDTVISEPDLFSGTGFNW